MKVSSKREESKCKMFYQNFKRKIFYTNLPRLIWLIENILLQNKHSKMGKYFPENILHRNKRSVNVYLLSISMRLQASDNSASRDNTFLGLLEH